MCVCGWMVTIPLLEGVLRDAIARPMVILPLERVLSTSIAIDHRRVLPATVLLDTNSAQTHGTEIRR